MDRRVGRTCHDIDRRLRLTFEGRQQNNRRLQQCYDGVERTFTQPPLRPAENRRISWPLCSANKRTPVAGNATAPGTMTSRRLDAIRPTGRKLPTSRAHTPPVEEALAPATGQPLPNGTAPPATGLGTTTPLRQLTSVIVSAQPFRFTGQVDMDGRGGAFFADEIDDDTVLGSDDGIFAWAAQSPDASTRSPDSDEPGASRRSPAASGRPVAPPAQSSPSTPLKTCVA